MTRVAYIDESQRGDFYAVAAVAIPHASVEVVRRQVKSLAPSGVARRHFVKESAAVRQVMLKTFAQLPAASYACVTNSSAAPVRQRAALLGALIDVLLADGLDRVFLDNVGPQQQSRDRQVLARELHGRDVAYDFFPPHATEPLLWIADAVAWCAGAKSEWRERIQGWVDIRQL